jgi:hypothetical protein
MRRSIVVVLAALSFGCGEPATTPRLGDIAPGRIELRGDVAFVADGAPQFTDKAVIPATFAVAIADSVAGAYILAFNDKGDGKGDFFVLRVEDLRTGLFGPCGPGPSSPGPDGSTFTAAGPCEGHLHQGLDAASETMTFSGSGFMRILNGSARVTDIGERFVGTVSNLTLSGFRADTVAGAPVATALNLTITDGEFDLPLLTGEAARFMTYCFLETVGKRSCTF